MSHEFKASFQADTFYHVYNRSNGAGRIFFSPRNRKFFLRRLKNYSNGVFDVYAYALLPNHFHVVIRIKHYEAFHDKLSQNPINVPPPRNVDKQVWNEMLLNVDTLFEDIVLARHVVEYISREQWRRLLLGYSKAVNKELGRHGSLFQKVFKRKEVPDKDLRRVIQYVHRNPVHHGLCDTPREFEWSSYNATLAGNKDLVKVHSVLEMFGGLEQFELEHTIYTTNWHAANSLEFKASRAA